MKFFKFSVLFLAIFIFFGCGKSALVMFDKDEDFQKALQYTEEKQLKNYFQTLAIFRATHLNQVYPQKYNDKEYFFVGIYIQDDMKKEKSKINNPQYALTLNGNKFLSYEEVDENNVLHKTMPFVNRWTAYYVVAFDKQESNEMTLEYKKDTNQSVSFVFKKYDKNNN